MSVRLQAPYPHNTTTTILPDPLFTDVRRTESAMTVSRTVGGRTIAHPQTSTKETLVLPFRLTRMKSLELEAFVQSYRAAVWRLTLHDASEWTANLVGPLSRIAAGRLGNDPVTGKEIVEVTLTFSAKRLS